MRASSIDSSRRSSISETKMKFSGRALFRRTGRRTTCPPEIAISDGINENFESSIDLSVLPGQAACSSSVSNPGVTGAFRSHLGRH